MSQKTEFVLSAKDETQAAFGSVNKSLNEFIANNNRASQTGSSSWGDFSNKTKFAIQNASYQITDFVVQVNGGTSAARALGQQLPQLLAGFGALGAVAGIVAGFSPQIIDFFRSGNEVKPLVDSLKALDGALGSIAEATQKFDMTPVFKQFNEANKAAREGIVSLIQYRKTLAEVSALDAEASLSKQMKDISDIGTLDKLIGGDKAVSVAKDLGIELNTAKNLLADARSGVSESTLLADRYAIALAKGSKNGRELAASLIAAAKGSSDAAAAQTAISDAMAKMRKAGASGQIDIDKKSSSKKADPTDPAENLINKLDKQIAVRALDLSTTEKLTAAEKEAAEVLQQIDSGIIKTTASQRELIKGKLEFLVAADKEIQAQEAYNAALKTAEDAMTSQRQKMIESIAAAEHQAEVYGLTESQLSAVTQSRLEDSIAMAEANGASEDTIKYLQEELRLRGELTDALIKVDKKRIEQQGAAAEQTNEFAQQAARNIQSTMADFLYDPFAEGVDKMGQKFGQMVQRMIADAAAAQLAKLLFGDMAGGAKSGGGGGDSGWIGTALSWAKKLMAADGHAFAGSGPVHAFAQGGAFGNGHILTQPTAFRFAKGGSFGNGIAGEAGPEGALPLKRMSNGKLGVYADGSGHQGMIIHQNITVGQGADTAQVRRSAAAGARAALGAVSGAQRYA